MDVVKEIGLPAFMEQTAEECCELAHACLKYARYLRGESPTPMKEEELILNFTEELADVKLCAEFVQNALAIRDIEIACWESIKYGRMKNRILEKKEKENEQSGKKESEEGRVQD